MNSQVLSKLLFILKHGWFCRQHHKLNDGGHFQIAVVYLPQIFFKKRKGDLIFSRLRASFPFSFVGRSFSIKSFSTLSYPFYPFT